MSTPCLEFAKKKSFLEHFGLISIIKEEKNDESTEKSKHFKISLDEIIVIDDDEDEVESNNSILPKERLKLLSKSKCTKSCKTKTFSKELRGMSRKLLMLDFSSPLGQKIDFSAYNIRSEFTKSNKNKISEDFFLPYEKWCSTEDKNPDCEVGKKKGKPYKKSNNNRSACEYNFRKRYKRNDNVQLSDRSKVLLKCMKTCLVSLPPIKISDKDRPTDRTENHPSQLDPSATICDIGPQSFIDNTEEKADGETTDKSCEVVVNESVKNNQVPQNDVFLNRQQLNEDNDLIKEVYSLVPGASPGLPSHLLEVGQSLINSQATRHNSLESISMHPASSNINNVTNLSATKENSDQVSSQHSSKASMSTENLNSINVIDLCDMETEDCYVLDSPNSGWRYSAVQPLKQVPPQIHSNEPSNDRIAANDIPQVLSFLCRICNKVIKCHGFHKNDMLNHYVVHHDIANVNLVPHTQNGKIVWRLVEESKQHVDFSESGFQKFRKRKKENNSLPDLEQSKRLKFDQGPCPLSSSMIAPSIASNCASVTRQLVTPFLKQNPAASGDQIFQIRLAKNLLTSDVICLD